MSQSDGKTKAALAWSSGKDSAYALHVVRAEAKFDVTTLLTTVTSAYGRVSMHGVREAILDAQAARAGLPLVKVPIPTPCPNELYERAMTEALVPLKRDGVSHVVFGDLFLEDIRAWREARLAELGMTGVFPLWGRNTSDLAQEMIAAGVEARIVCLDPAKIDRDLAGHMFDPALLARLGEGTDPCGENGEFHTLATGGPFFDRTVETEAGRSVERDGFIFTEVYLKPEQTIGDKQAETL